MFNLIYNGCFNFYLFYVVNSGGLIILGLLICIDMNFVIFNYIIIYNELIFMVGIILILVGNLEVKK